jgi:two-component system cell cycle response regulator DivK
MTANVMVDDVERARAAGFDGFLGKPIDLRRFPLQITRILQGERVWEPR